MFIYFRIRRFSSNSKVDDISNKLDLDDAAAVGALENAKGKPASAWDIPKYSAKIGIAELASEEYMPSSQLSGQFLLQFVPLKTKQHLTSE